MASDPGEAFRDRLRTLRRSLKLSQEAFAERAGLNAKHYQEIERGGKTEVRFSTLVRLAEAYGIPLHELFWNEPTFWMTAETPAPYGPSPGKKPGGRSPRKNKSR